MDDLEAYLHDSVISGADVQPDGSPNFDADSNAATAYVVAFTGYVFSISNNIPYYPIFF